MIDYIIYHSSNNMNYLLIHYIKDNHIVCSCLFTTTNLLSNYLHNLTNSGYILPGIKGYKYEGNYVLSALEPINLKEYYKRLYKKKENILVLYKNTYLVHDEWMQMINSFVLLPPVSKINASKINMTW